MFTILLTILKVLGIILLSIVGFIVLILLIILFSPIRYSIYSKKEPETEENNTQFYIEGKISFLFHLLNAKISYPSEELFRVRIALFKLFPRKEKIKKEELRAEDIGIYDKEEKDSIIDAALEKDGLNKTDDESETDNNTEVLPEQSKAEDEQCLDSESEVNELLTENAETEEKKNKDSVFAKIRRFLDKIRLTLSKSYDNIKNSKKVFQDYLDIINSRAFKNSFALCKKKLFFLLRCIRPRYYKGYVRFGFEEPDTVSELYGIYSVFYPYIGKKFKAYPVFGEKCFDYEIRIRGHIRVIVLIMVAVSMYFNKDIKRTIKMLKKEKQDGR